MPDRCTKALAYFAARRDSYFDSLKELIRIPSVSFPGFDARGVRSCCDAVSDLMKDQGLQEVRQLEGNAGYPSVFGQWCNVQNAPTVLLYAHYDVQPPGRAELWTTSPFDPTVRDGRLYGRGAADDKGGILMHLAAVGSYLRSCGSLPANVKVLIEGEEEVGSSNLEQILTRNRDLLAADAVVIADSENFESGHPSLTASLRGIATITVEVRSLTSSVHSGTWGGPLPDPVLALAKMLATLVDEQGRPAVPGLTDSVRVLSQRDRTSLESLPFREATYRHQSKLLDGVAIIGGAGSVYEKMWYLPSIAVNAFEASSRKQAANIINDTAWARIGVRIVPDMDPQKTQKLLKDHLLKQAPWGVQVEIGLESPAHWWRTDTNGPLFASASSALTKGYGKAPAIVGAGGSIPFVQTITDMLGGVPALLFGVGDPYAAAHSENESLLIADWESASRSLIHFFSEIGGPGK